MHYFKHYHNANTSLAVQGMIDEFGVEGYAYYFLLLELLCEKFDGESTKVELHLSEIQSTLRIKLTKKLAKVLEHLPNSSVTFVGVSKKVYFFDAPILLLLQDKDFKYATKKRRDGDAKIKEERIKNKEERIKNKNISTEQIFVHEEAPQNTIHEKLNDAFLIPFLTTVKHEAQEAWFKTYEDDLFVKTELMKACTWIINNKRKAPKARFGNFFSSWLDRGWDSYRKGHASSRSIYPVKKTVTEHAQEQINNNPFRKESA